MEKLHIELTLYSTGNVLKIDGEVIDYDVDSVDVLEILGSRFHEHMDINVEYEEDES